MNYTKIYAKMCEVKKKNSYTRLFLWFKMESGFHVVLIKCISLTDHHFCDHLYQSKGLAVFCLWLKQKCVNTIPGGQTSAMSLERHLLMPIILRSYKAISNITFYILQWDRLFANGKHLQLKRKTDASLHRSGSPRKFTP